ncbi:hypothetical protein HDU81_004874 [Chytriomyces hyalinus]|nr:hypothetical protein HDU81_004874 [Chytriomyces hyalinus]
MHETPWNASRNRSDQGHQHNHRSNGLSRDRCRGRDEHRDRDRYREQDRHRDQDRHRNQVRPREHEGHRTREQVREREVDLNQQHQSAVEPSQADCVTVENSATVATAQVTGSAESKPAVAKRARDENLLIDLYGSDDEDADGGGQNSVCGTVAADSSSGGSLPTRIDSTNQNVAANKTAGERKSNEPLGTVEVVKNSSPDRSSRTPDALVEKRRDEQNSISVGHHQRDPHLDRRSNPRVGAKLSESNKTTAAVSGNGHVVPDMGRGTLSNIHRNPSPPEEERKAQRRGSESTQKSQRPSDRNRASIDNGSKHSRTTDAEQRSEISPAHEVRQLESKKPDLKNHTRDSKDRANDHHDMEGGKREKAQVSNEHIEAVEQEKRSQENRASRQFESRPRLPEPLAKHQDGLPSTAKPEEVRKRPRSPSSTENVDMSDPPRRDRLSSTVVKRKEVPDVNRRDPSSLQQVPMKPESSPPPPPLLPTPSSNSSQRQSPQPASKRLKSEVYPEVPLSIHPSNNPASDERSGMTASLESSKQLHRSVPKMEHTPVLVESRPPKNNVLPKPIVKETIRLAPPPIATAARIAPYRAPSSMTPFESDSYAAYCNAFNDHVKRRVPTPAAPLFCMVGDSPEQGYGYTIWTPPAPTLPPRTEVNDISFSLENHGSEPRSANSEKIIESPRKSRQRVSRWNDGSALDQSSPEHHEEKKRKLEHSDSRPAAAETQPVFFHQPQASVPTLPVTPTPVVRGDLPETQRRGRYSRRSSPPPPPPLSVSERKQEPSKIPVIEDREAPKQSSSSSSKNISLEPSLQQASIDRQPDAVIGRLNPERLAMLGQSVIGHSSEIPTVETSGSHNLAVKRAGRQQRDSLQSENVNMERGRPKRAPVEEPRYFAQDSHSQRTNAESAQARSIPAIAPEITAQAAQPPPPPPPPPPADYMERPQEHQHKDSHKNQPELPLPALSHSRGPLPDQQSQFSQLQNQKEHNRTYRRDQGFNGNNTMRPDRRGFGAHRNHNDNSRWKGGRGGGTKEDVFGGNSRQDRRNSLDKAAVSSFEMESSDCPEPVHETGQHNVSMALNIGGEDLMEEKLSVCDMVSDDLADIVHSGACVWDGIDCVRVGRVL